MSEPADALPAFERPRYERGVLASLEVDGCNIVRPWGVEFADSSSFFSLEDGVGYRYVELDRATSETSAGRQVTLELGLREGRVRLEVEEGLRGPRRYWRACRLECLEATTLMDFVLRFRFSAEHFRVGHIAGRTFQHEKSNVYHQFPTDRASLTNEAYAVTVRAIRHQAPPSLKAHCYLRDSEREWVIHLRMLPTSWDREVVKLCSGWFGTRPLPQWLSRPLLAVPGVRQALWYRGETRPYRGRVARAFAPNAFPMVRLPRGSVLAWEGECVLERPMSEPRGRVAAGGEG